MTFLAVSEKRRRLLYTPGMQTSASMLVSIAVLYTGPIGYGIAVPYKYTFYMFPLDLGEYTKG